MNEQQEQATEQLLLLGEDEFRYGEYTLKTLVSGRVAASLTVGADPDSPALQFKGSRTLPNEDALFVMDAGHRVLLAVADAHHGTFASHGLLRGLAETMEGVPASPMALARLVRDAAGEAPPGDTSATTLLLAVLRRDMGAGFGYSWGDSSCALVGGRSDGRPLNRPNQAYLDPSDASTFAADRASFFEFDTAPDQLVLAFTDGLNECHYHHPESSLGPAQLREVFAEVGAAPEAFARRATEWALRGLEPNPGGQDNLALVVVAT